MEPVRNEMIIILSATATIPECTRPGFKFALVFACFCVFGAELGEFEPRVSTRARLFLSFVPCMPFFCLLCIFVQISDGKFGRRGRAVQRAVHAHARRLQELPRV